MELPASSAAAFAAMDLNRDGWTDLAIANHRDDASHRVDSVIYWNSSTGFDVERVSRLPTHGVHGMTSRDFGNGYTRKPEESYVSPPLPLGTRKPYRIHWVAEVPSPAQLKFQLRWAPSPERLEDAPWTGPTGESSFYEESGQEVGGNGIGSAQWLQYKAIFVSPYGCRSPKLREVRFDLRAPEAELRSEEAN